MTTGTIHIMLVDDHPLVRDGLRARLEAVPHFRVVAEADSGFDALALAGSTRMPEARIDLDLRRDLPFVADQLVGIDLPVMIDVENLGEVALGVGLQLVRR